MSGDSEQPRKLSSYRQLKVWQVGIDLGEETYLLTRKLPPEERFVTASRMWKAASSVPANIAGGCGRGKRGEYLYFLQVAQGSLKELETRLLLCERASLLRPGRRSSPSRCASGSVKRSAP